MNTPSHFLLHLAVRKYCKAKKNIEIPKSFVLGAIAPDIILFILVFSYIPLSTLLLGNSLDYTFNHMFDELYFNNPFWIFGYNLLHSPMLLLIFFGILSVFKRNLGKYHKILMWFIIGCFLHTLLDIPLHHDDGPRIFYPFLSYTFASPISYWDPNYYGKTVGIIELMLSISFCSYVFVIPLYKKYCLGKE